MMVTAQRTEEKRIYVQNSKYGRRNWKPGEVSSLPGRRAMKLTKRAFVMAAILMACLVLVVVMSAYTAQIRYQINTISRENTDIQAEIDQLRLTLEKDRNIIKLEERAASELGMKYPEQGEVIYLKHVQDTQSLAKK